jgi:hypothetical protein
MKTETRREIEEKKRRRKFEKQWPNGEEELLDNQSKAELS